METRTLAIAGIGAGIAGLITAAYAIKELMDAKKKLSEAVEKVTGDINVDISEAIVKEATDKAIERAADRAAQLAVSSIKHEFDDDIRSEVRKAVDECKSSLKSDIKDRIEKQIGYIDISEAKREVIEKASAHAAETFKSDLDTIIANHNKELEQMQKIYGNIANTLKGGIVQ